MATKVKRATTGRAAKQLVAPKENIRKSAKPQTDQLGLSIGARLKSIRKSKLVTLDMLAEKVGFTKGYLSKLETGTRVPPIATLATIATALGVDIASLLGQHEPQPHSEVSVVRAEERPTIIRGGSVFGYDYQGLTQADATSKRMQPFIFRFPAQLLREVYFEHSGEELLFVLSGKLEIEVSGERYQLSIGDCIHFSASARHRAHGIDGEATALVVTLDENSRRVDQAG
jgi:transcriptional regulator with XRE-family HTH domain